MGPHGAEGNSGSEPGGPGATAPPIHRKGNLAAASSAIHLLAGAMSRPVFAAICVGGGREIAVGGVPGAGTVRKKRFEAASGVVSYARRFEIPALTPTNVFDAEDRAGRVDKRAAAQANHTHTRTSGLREVECAPDDRGSTDVQDPAQAAVADTRLAAASEDG